MQIMRDYKWGTHIPLIKGVLDLYKPEWVLESGIGLHSTPCFNSGIEYIGVENDKNWVEFVREKFPDRNFIYHELKGIDLATRWHNISTRQKLEICLYYAGLDLPTDSLGILFVDGYTSTRRLVINTLSDKIDIIIYHDCQPKSRKVYNYENIKTKDFTTYYLTSPSSWTGVMLRNDVGIGKLKEAVAPYIKEFTNQWPEVTKMEIIHG